MTNILLLTIAVTGIVRLILSLKKPTKKLFFTNELYFLIKRIWNEEFTMFQKKDMREGIRKEYDYMNARLEKINTDIKNWPKDGDKDEKARREDDKVRTETEIKALEEQMKGLDLEVYGSKPCAEYPDGQMGISGKIESLREVQLVLEDWIKTL